MWKGPSIAAVELCAKHACLVTFILVLMVIMKLSKTLKSPLLGAGLGNAYGDSGMPIASKSNLGLADMFHRKSEQYVWHHIGYRR